MITKSIKYFFVAGTVCCGLTTAMTSCSDMLDTTSELVEFEEDNTLNHSTDSVYSVLGIINTMQTIADRNILLGEVRGDLVVTTPNASVDLKRLAEFDFTKENKYNQASDYAAVINNCNYYLAHVDTALQRRGRTLFKQEYAAVKGFRAWTYLQMALAYGDVPLFTEPLMTENAAFIAANKAKSSIADICNYFIADLTPYADVNLPQFGITGDWESDYFFIPMKALLGDLCLWAGRYNEAAKWYHDYLNDEKKPIQLNVNSRIQWTNASDFQVRPTNAYNVTSINEILSYIPMEERIFDGTVSDLDNVYNSTRENKYFFQLTPSAGMRQLSADQIYCMANQTGTQTDTIYVPRTGLLDDIYVGDLRFSANYSQNPRGGQDAYSEYSSVMQTIDKLNDNMIPTYRRTMVYLRYAEALNRANLPQSAFAVLKYGLCNENATKYIDSLERVSAGSLIDFDPNIFDATTVKGIHSRGSGDSECNAYYALPQPATALATRQDTIDYQIPLLEDMIITEMALEGSFEGYRFYDLMRIALRRNDASYLANPIARRSGTNDETLRQKLLNKSNWYLPLP